jgi:hypothetical protein
VQVAVILYHASPVYYDYTQLFTGVSGVSTLMYVLSKLRTRPRSNWYSTGDFSSCTLTKIQLRRSSNTNKHHLCYVSLECVTAGIQVFCMLRLCAADAISYLATGHCTLRV